MENSFPLAQPNNGHLIFAALRDVLADLYPEENDARVVVADAGLDAKQIPFSSRAQTNWHNILAEAIRQARLDPLLKIALADYAANPVLLAAFEQYRLLIEQGGYLEAPVSLPADADVTITGDVNLNQGDFVGRDKVIYLGLLKISKPVVGILFTGLATVALFIGAIALYARNMSEAITAPTPTATPTIPTATPTRTPLPTATPLAFATQAVSETLIVIATFHNTADTDSEAHKKIHRAIATAAASHNEQQLRVEVESTELNADQRVEAEILGKRYNASMVIWGEDTGVEVIVNFLNLKEPNVSASVATIIEREQTQLANPSAYVRFITQGLPQTMSFFAFFAIGQSYFLNAQYTLAIERIEAAVAMVSPDAKPEGLAEAYFRLGWLYQVPTPSDLTQAFANYDKAIQLGLDFATVYNNRGSARFTQGKLDEAIADYTKAIHLNPNYGAAYYNRGISHKIQGKLDEAIADYTQAIHLNPDLEVAYNNRGNVLSAQGMLEEAIADFDKAIYLNPYFAEAYYNRGNALYKQERWEEAIADFDKAVYFNPKDADAYNSRGIARAMQGELSEAIVDYDQAIYLDPDYADAYNSRGIARATQGKLDEAIADFDKAIHLNSVFVEAYYNRGKAHSIQGRLDEAIADYDHAIHLNSNYASAFWGRGLAYRDLDKPKEALADFRRYLELQPNTEDRAQVEQWIAEIEAELAKLK